MSEPADRKQCSTVGCQSTSSLDTVVCIFGDAILRFHKHLSLPTALDVSFSRCLTISLCFLSLTISICFSFRLFFCLSFYPCLPLYVCLFFSLSLYVSLCVFYFSYSRCMSFFLSRLLYVCLFLSIDSGVRVKHQRYILLPAFVATLTNSLL